MAEPRKPIDDLDQVAKQAVERTMEQARGAMEKYFDFLQKTMSLHAWRGSDLGEKLRSYTEQNIAAAQDYVQKLSHAKDFSDVMRIQTEFIQTQMSAFGEQTKSLGEASTKAIGDAMKMPGDKSS